MTYTILVCHIHACICHKLSFLAVYSEKLTPSARCFTFFNFFFLIRLVVSLGTIKNTLAKDLILFKTDVTFFSHFALEKFPN